MESEALLLLSRVAAPIAPREYRGNMCGIHVPGLPPVDGGAADASLVLSWFYSRYSAEWRAAIRSAWKARGALDVLVSWPDDRGFGLSANQHVAMCQELAADGFRPCDMLGSKVYDPRDDAAGTLANIQPVLSLLRSTDAVSRYGVGWELNLWNSPASLQAIIDGLAPSIVASGRPLYVHFSGGVFAWQPDGQSTADFWKANVGKLTGILHQRDFSSSPTFPTYQARIVDCLERFAGGFGFPTDSGFGHPFDFIALEITAQPQFNGEMDEATGDAWGMCALNTPPSGNVRVMGSGNGQD